MYYVLRLARFLTFKTDRKDELYKVLALFAAIALVINICAPTMVNADLIQDGKADLEVMQSDESGLYLYNGERGKVNLKYLFYIYYPLHLIIIGIIRLVIYGNIPLIFK